MYEIEQVIKHRAPMCLIDKLISFDENSAKVSLVIKDTSTFFQKSINGVHSHVGIEYMAQAIAAYSGANALATNQEVKLGFLLGTRKFKSSVEYYQCGSELIVRVNKLLEDTSGLSVFECSIEESNVPTKILVTAKVNVFQPADAEKYFQEQK